MPARTAIARKISKPKQVSALVLERLRNDIVVGNFEFGEKLSEGYLTEIYGVTKSPIRAAIILLQSEGLVTVKPQSGTFVFNPSNAEVRALCELRIALETEAAQLAMKGNLFQLRAEFAKILAAMQKTLDGQNYSKYLDLDADLHLAIVSSAKSPILETTYKEKIHSQFAALRSRFGKADTHIEASIAEHRALHDTLSQNDIPTMRSLLRTHIGQTENHYQRMVR